MRLAFVVQRYGIEVAGGAELHCRWLAEQLVGRHQVEVFTTQARDHMSWAHGYAAGTATVNGIPIHRFPVTRTRSPRRIASLSRLVFGLPHTRAEEEAWVRENGPWSPALVAAVAAARDRFDLFVFYSYRYYPTFYGLPPVRDRAILVPTAEEDAAIGLGIFHELFRMPRGIAYLTPEERDLVESAAGGTGRPSAVMGSGLTLPEPSPASDVRERLGLRKPYLLYVGRIERSKGCEELFTYFRKFVEETGADLDLVLAGKAMIDVPEHPRIRPLGFVSEEEKVGLLRDAVALAMPSRYESLSVVLLEAWKTGVPVVANGRCKVLAGQCRRSGGGLCYDGYFEWRDALSLLIERGDLRAALGRQGREYVERECAWDVVIPKLEDLFAQAREAEPVSPCP